jgi:nitrogen fixation/metabolism regulation signal transduction histidine kinase
VSLVLPGSSGRYVVHREPFRVQGRRHTLLILVEVETALRSERQQAWESLVRVLAHEINNSLTPIKSIAGTLADLLAQRDGLSDEELQRQLRRIAHRADSLVQFVQGYANIARLPEPRPEIVDIARLVAHCIELEDGLEAALEGEALTLRADPVLLEQALINLLKNACDSTPEGQSPRLRIAWRHETHRDEPGLRLEVIDAGLGLAATENLFVPFFTTKPGGSGVGLLLARRIAELHHGTLDLRNRDDGRRGAVASLWLPLRGVERPPGAAAETAR